MVFANPEGSLYEPWVSTVAHTVATVPKLANKKLKLCLKTLKYLLPKAP